MQKACQIDPTLFTEYDVKRGLRNSDGSGIRVGLSKIGDAVGYEPIPNGGLKPIPGRLIYRGINIDDIVHNILEQKRFGFEETIFLLLSGKLPNRAQLEAFNQNVTASMALSDATKASILNLPGGNIMNILSRSVLVMYAEDENPDELSAQNLLRQSIRLICQFPTIIAYAYGVYRHRHYGEALDIRPPKDGLSIAENFLYMVKRDYTPLEARVLDLQLILHAEHGGGNNSTFTVRATSSSATDTYSSIAAGVCSLKGPLHGGANVEVVNMFNHLKENIRNWEDNAEIDQYFERILRKEVYNKVGLIYGIGHAVYTLSDPRSLLLRDLARDLSKEKGREREFTFLERLEERAVATFNRVKAVSGKRVSSNVDFYSGFVYEMIGLAKELYTPLFAMSRVVGWTAHRNEEILSNKRLMRPSYKNISTKQEYIPLADR